MTNDVRRIRMLYAGGGKKIAVEHQCCSPEADETKNEYRNGSIGASDRQDRKWSAYDHRFVLIGDQDFHYGKENQRAVVGLLPTMFAKAAQHLHCPHARGTSSASESGMIALFGGARSAI